MNCPYVVHRPVRLAIIDHEMANVATTVAKLVQTVCFSTGEQRVMRTPPVRREFLQDKIGRDLESLYGRNCMLLGRHGCLAKAWKKMYQVGHEEDRESLS